MCQPPGLACRLETISQGSGHTQGRDPESSLSTGYPPSVPSQRLIQRLGFRTTPTRSLLKCRCPGPAPLHWNLEGAQESVLTAFNDIPPERRTSGPEESPILTRRSSALPSHRPPCPPDLSPPDPPSMSATKRTMSSVPPCLCN